MDAGSRSPHVLWIAFVVQTVFNVAFWTLLFTNSKGMGSVGDFSGVALLTAIGTFIMFASYLIGYAIARRVVAGRRPGWVWLAFPLGANALYLVAASLAVLAYV